MLAVSWNGAAPTGSVEVQGAGPVAGWQVLARTSTSTGPVGEAPMLETRMMFDRTGYRGLSRRSCPRNNCERALTTQRVQARGPTLCKQLEA